MIAPALRMAAPIRWALERLSIYTPVALMALLALGSYWLLRATPPVPPEPVARPEVHEPSDRMRRFAVRTYGPTGDLQSEVFGEEARHFPDDGSMEIDQARLRSLSPEGVVTTARAQRLWTNAEQDQFVLTGNALIVREAATLPSGQALERLQFQGEHLHLFGPQRRIVAEQPVVLMRGASRITADRMVYTDNDRVAQLSGRVKAQLASRREP